MQKSGRHIILSITLTVAFLLSCRQKNLHAEQISNKDSASKAVVANADLSHTNITDTLDLALGTYTCNCTPDASKQIKLLLSKTKNEYSAKLIYDAGHVQVGGKLNRDTLNFDKDFNIWSFTKGKTVYGFRLSKNDNNGIDVALINEDYKKEFESCSDAKEIDFIKH